MARTDTRPYLWAACLLAGFLLVNGQALPRYGCNFDDQNDPLCGFTQLTNDDIDFTRISGKTPSSNTGPERDHTTGGGSYVYLEATNRNQGDTARLQSPMLKDRLGGYEGPYCLSMFYHMKGSHIGSLTVFTVNGHSPALKEEWKNVGEQGDSWREYRMNLVRDTSYVVIEAVRGDAYQGDIAIDDVTVTASSCDGQVGPPPIQPPINPCQSIQCFNGGTCLRNGTSFNCTCMAGFTGRMCATPVRDPCQNIQCLNGGSCLRNGSNWNCTCMAGFTGRMCETPVRDQCQNIRCLNGGSCRMNGTNWNCSCMAGFTGRMCEIPVRDPCQNNRCLNGGSCRRNGTNWNCSCMAGFTGRICETPVGDPCQSSPCLNGGMCRRNGTAWNCTCAPGFMGRWCETPDMCNPNNPCLNGGRCSSTGHFWSCACPHGFGGRMCEMRDPCQSYPCLNGGRCMANGPTWNCTCLAGFAGRLCEIGGTMTRPPPTGGPTRPPPSPPPTTGNGPLLFQCNFESRCDLYQETHMMQLWDVARGQDMIPNAPWWDHTTGTGKGVFSYLNPQMAMAGGAPRFDKLSAPMTARWMSPVVTYNGPICLEFHYHMTSGRKDTLDVQLVRGSGPGYAKTGVLRLNGDQGPQWRLAQVTIRESAGYQVALGAMLGHKYGMDGIIAIDDVKAVTGACVERAVVEPIQVRLAGAPYSPNVTEGRVEVMHNGQWGSVCREGFGWKEASTVCRMLGMRGGRTKALPHYGSGPSKVWLSNLECPTWGAASLHECRHPGWGMSDCDMNDYASVRCNVPEHNYAWHEIRLADTKLYGNSWEGRVEVRHKGQWGTICSQGWDYMDASAVCKTFGFNGQAYATYSVTPAPSGTPIWLTNTSCTGREMDFSECGHAPWGNNTCRHNQDVGVKCTFVPSNVPFRCDFENGQLCQMVIDASADFPLSLVYNPTMASMTNGQRNGMSLSGSTYGIDAGVARLCTPNFKVMPSSGPHCLEFSYMADNYNGGHLKVVMKQGSEKELIWWTNDYQVTGTWIPVSTEVEGHDFSLCFEISQDHHFQGSVYIDDISVNEGRCTGTIKDRPTPPPNYTPPTGNPPQSTVDPWSTWSTDRPVTSTQTTTNYPTRQTSTTYRPSTTTGWWHRSTTKGWWETSTTTQPSPGQALLSCTFDRDSCEARLRQAVGDIFNWTRGTNTPSGGTGPSVDHTQQTSQGYFMYIEASDPRIDGDTARLETVQMYPRNNNGRCLVLWYHMHGVSTGQLRVYNTEPNEPMKKIMEISGPQGDEWKQALAPLPANGGRVTIEAVRDGGYQGDIAIDDVTIREGTCCPALPNCDFEGFCCFTQGDEGDLAWNRHQGQTPSSGTGPQVDHTYGSSTGSYMYLEVSGQSQDQSAILVSSPLDDQGALCMVFYYNMFGPGVGTLNARLQAKDQDSDEGSVAWTMTGDQGQDWKMARVQIPEMTHTVSLQATVGPSYQGDIAIDDISFSRGTC